MNDQPDTSFLARLLGQNWRTTLGGTLSAAGGVLATQTTGKWQIAGGIMLAVGLQWLGVSARDKGVSTAQMDAAGSGQPIPQAKLPGSLLTLLVALATMLALCGCGTIATRSMQGYDLAGGRPYEAVVQDGVLCGYVADGGFNFVTAFVGLASMPVDLVVDTVMLPPDLIAGEFYGCKKQPAWNMLKNDL
jgi:uncharacterized protein YceK